MCTRVMADERFCDHPRQIDLVDTRFISELPLMLMTILEIMSDIGRVKQKLSIWNHETVFQLVSSNYNISLSGDNLVGCWIDWEVGLLAHPKARICHLCS